LQRASARCYASAGLEAGRGSGPSTTDTRDDVDIVATLTSINLFDLLTILFLFAMFVLGYIQGTIRRLVGTLSFVFSFFLAAQLAVPFGEFLKSYWTNYPDEYSQMIAFLTLFGAAVVAFFLVIQGTYSKTELFSRWPVIDEIAGGLVGVAQGLLLLVFITIILDQYFVYAPVTAPISEVPFLRSFWTALNGSGVGALLHGQVIPNFVNLFSFLIPDFIKATYAL
jgi:uncharacterized membrane protein required for colicin V production